MTIISNIFSNKYLKYVLIFIFIVIIILVYVYKISRLPTNLEIYIFNTKGNPSIFIRTPDDTRILIDGGADNEIISHITNIIPFYSRRIDTIIVTNDDNNSVTGLIDVVNRYKVGQVIIPGVSLKELGLYSSIDPIYETFIDSINKLKIPIRKVIKGDRLDLSEKLKAEILFPVIIGVDNLNVSTSTKAFKYSNASPPEIVMKINYSDTSFLLIGNASLKIQKFIANSQISSSSNTLSSNVLLVPHKISTSTVSVNLINIINPQYELNLKEKNTTLVLSDGELVEIR